MKRHDAIMRMMNVVVAVMDGLGVSDGLVDNVSGGGGI